MQPVNSHLESGTSCTAPEYPGNRFTVGHSAGDIEAGARTLASGARPVRRARYAFERRHAAYAMKTASVGCDITAAILSAFPTQAKASGSLWSIVGVGNGAYRIMLNPACSVANGIGLLSDLATTGAGSTSSAPAFLSDKTTVSPALLKTLNLASYGFWVVAGTSLSTSAIYIHVSGRVVTLASKDRITMLATASLTASGLFSALAGLLGLLNTAVFDGNQSTLRDLTVAFWLTGAVLDGLGTLLGQMNDGADARSDHPTMRNE